MSSNAPRRGLAQLAGALGAAEDAALAKLRVAEAEVAALRGRLADLEVPSPPLDMQGGAGLAAALDARRRAVRQQLMPMLAAALARREIALAAARRAVGRRIAFEAVRRSGKVR